MNPWDDHRNGPGEGRKGSVMKKGMRVLALLLCGIWMLCLPAQTALASEGPYQTYLFDRWSNPVPLPNGYVPVRSVSGSQIGCGDFNNGADLFYSKARDEIYVADAGNARIVVLDANLEFVRQYDALTRQDGSEYAFSAPQGIYVLDDGTMYIAESGNHEVVRCDIQGRIQQIFGTPETSLLGETFEYRPDKVVVDERGRIYVLARGVYQGMIYLEPDGTFIKFFGSRNVVLSAKDQFRKLFRSLLTDEASATMQAFIPLEYSNIFMDSEGYIYGTVIGEGGKDVLSRINPVGINALPYKMNTVDKIEYADVTADEYGIVTMLDRRFGTILQRSDSGVIFTLGGTGDQVGLFRRPVSLIQAHDNLYVLDADKNTITELEITEFGRLVHSAIRMYMEGRYEESIGPWQEVIRRSANYLPAYSMLGKAYYQMGDYDTAMYYSKLGEEPSDYSDAYKGASLLRIRDAFGGIVIGSVVLIIAVVVFKRYRAGKQKGKGAAA